MELSGGELDGLAAHGDEVHEQFGEYKADRSEHADHREMPHGVQMVLRQHIERD